MKLLLLATGFAVAILATPVAWADGADAAFVNQLDQIGLGCGGGAIKCDNDQDLVGIGHDVCYDLDTNGDTASGAANKLNDVGGDYMSKVQARELVGLSVGAYCSWDLPRVISSQT